MVNGSQQWRIYIERRRSFEVSFRSFILIITFQWCYRIFEIFEKKPYVFYFILENEDEKVCMKNFGEFFFKRSLWSEIQTNPFRGKCKSFNGVLESGSSLFDRTIDLFIHRRILLSFLMTFRFRQRNRSYLSNSLRCLGSLFRDYEVCWVIFYLFDGIIIDWSQSDLLYYLKQVQKFI